MTEPLSNQPAAELAPEARGRTLASGVAWIGAARWSSQVLSWAITLLVVRILTPADYGLVGMTTFFIVVASVLAESGIGVAVVALRDLTPQAIRQLHTLALGTGFAAAALSAAAAWPASWYFHEPALVAVLTVLGTSFALDGLRVVPVATLNRELNYRAVSSVDLVRAVAGSLTTLFLAIRGAGYWALVGGTVVGSAAASGWVLRARRIGLERPRWSTLSAPLRYCRHLVVGSLAYNAYQTSDFMVAGRLFGPGLLGQYNLAWTIAWLPGAKLVAVILAATTPFFAAIQQDRQALAGYFLKLTRFLALVLWPILFGFLIIADLAIPGVLGAKWVPAVPITRALLIFAALMAVTLTHVILNVTGHSRTSMQASLISLLVLPPAFFAAGKQGGVLGIAWTWTVVGPLIQCWALSRALAVLQVPFRQYLAIFRRPVFMVGMMCAFIALIRHLLPDRTPAFAELALSVLAAVVSYGVICLLFAREELATLWRMLRRAGN